MSVKRGPAHPISEVHHGHMRLLAFFLSLSLSRHCIHVSQGEGQVIKPPKNIHCVIVDGLFLLDVIFCSRGSKINKRDRSRSFQCFEEKKKKRTFYDMTTKSPPLLATFSMTEVFFFLLPPPFTSGPLQSEQQPTARHQRAWHGRWNRS